MPLWIAVTAGATLTGQEDDSEQQEQRPAHGGRRAAAVGGWLEVSGRCLSGSGCERSIYLGQPNCVMLGLPGQYDTFSPFTTELLSSPRGSF